MIWLASAAVAGLQSRGSSAMRRPVRRASTSNCAACATLACSIRVSLTTCFDDEYVARLLQLYLCRRLVEVPARGREQRAGAVDVGRDELAGPFDRLPLDQHRLHVA